MPDAVREAARSRYVAEFPRLRDAAADAGTRLKALLSDLAIAKASVSVREKSIGSFVKKLRNYGDDCWEMTTDKVGAQVTVLTLEDLRKIRAALEAGWPGFVYKRTEDKAADADPKFLEYTGLHVQVALDGWQLSDGEPIECEVQLRTQAQDVWANLSHRLIYKPVIEPPPGVERTILRLSVLTEMFDEEVERAVQIVRADARYSNALVLRAAEDVYLEFVAEPGDEELSLEVLGVIESALPGEGYSAVLRKFAETRREDLAQLYNEYGIASPFAEQFGYFLFSQPESIVILERLANARMALKSAVIGSEMQDAVERLAAAWGEPIY